MPIDNKIRDQKLQYYYIQFTYSPLEKLYKNKEKQLKIKE